MQHGLWLIILGSFLCTACMGKGNNDGSPKSFSTTPSTVFLVSKSSSFQSGLSIINDHLYLRADDGSRDELSHNNASSLWISKGTVEETSLIRDFSPDSFGQPKAFRDKAILATGSYVNDFGDLANATELWLSDGTDSGTELLFSNFLRAADQLIVTPENVFFSATSNDLEDGLWKTDGTRAGTNMFYVFEDNPNNNTVGAMVAIGNRLFFQFGASLWLSDGTAEGTHLFFDTTGNSRTIAVFGDHLVFTVENGRNESLWLSDGSVEGSIELKSFAASVFGKISRIVSTGGRLFFRADDGEHGQELWVSDGTPEGTQLVKDIFLGEGSANPDTLVAGESHVFFFADDGVHGRELWISDGTEAGTSLVKDISVGSSSSDPNENASISVETSSLPLAAALESKLWFAADDGENGVELWISDGTALGTTLVQDIAIGATSSSPHHFHAGTSHVFFQATAANGTTGLWVGR